MSLHKQFKKKWFIFADSSRLQSPKTGNSEQWELEASDHILSTAKKEKIMNTFCWFVPLLHLFSRGSSKGCCCPCFSPAASTTNTIPYTHAQNPLPQVSPNQINQKTPISISSEEHPEIYFLKVLVHNVCKSLGMYQVYSVESSVCVGHSITGDICIHSFTLILLNSQSVMVGKGCQVQLKVSDHMTNTQETWSYKCQCSTCFLQLNLSQTLPHWWCLSSVKSFWT